MRLEKHITALQEVMDEIQMSLEDPRGLVAHQRRLATMLSIGTCELIEIYFHKLGIMKGGGRIKHTILRRKGIEEQLSNQIISTLSNIKNIDVIITIAKTIEAERDNMAYGSPQPHEQLLKAKIEDFLELKRIIEKEIGDVI